MILFSFGSFFNSFPSIIDQGLIWGLMAIGLFLTFKILDFPDLTVDGSLVTGAVVAAMLIRAGWPAEIASLMAFFAGACCGVVTGLLHTFFGIPAILSGILTQLALWSLNIKILGDAANVPVSWRNYRVMVSSNDTLHALWVLAIVIAIAIGLIYWFFGTDRGVSIRATGCNEKMARANGINTSVNKVIALAVSNAFVALAGSLLMQYQGFADVKMGQGAIVIGLASITIGLAICNKFSRNFALTLGFVVLGSIIYYTVYGFVIALGFDPNLFKMLSAIVVAAFLGIPYIKNKYLHFSKKKEKKHA